MYDFIMSIFGLVFIALIVLFFMRRKEKKQDKESTKYKKPFRNTLIAFAVLFVVSGAFSDDDETEEVVEEDTEEEVADTEEEPIEDESTEEEKIKTIEEIANEQDYVLNAESIEEEYTLGTEENIEVFSPSNDYRIQIEYDGGFFGTDELEMIEELIENISEESAEYDYLVFEVLDEDEEYDEIRSTYTRLNQEQASELLNSDDLSNDTYEEVADFFVQGDDADIGFNEEAINYDDMTAEELIEHSASNRFRGEIKELHVDETDAGIDIDILIENGTSWSESTALTTMQDTSARFLGNLHDYELDYNNVSITFEAILIDQAGNESLNDVLISEYSDETIKEINPENILVVSENLESLSDTWWLHPAYHGE